MERGVRANALGFAFYLPETGFGMGRQAAGLVQDQVELGPPVNQPRHLPQGQRGRASAPPGVRPLPGDLEALPRRAEQEGEKKTFFLLALALDG